MSTEMARGAVDAPRGDSPVTVRELLVRYQQALTACEALAMVLLETLTPDAAPLTGEQAHQLRQAAADALAMAQDGRRYADQGWTVAGVERRIEPAAPLPADVATDRRRKSPRRPSREPPAAQARLRKA